MPLQPELLDEVSCLAVAICELMPEPLSMLCSISTMICRSTAGAATSWWPELSLARCCECAYVQADLHAARCTVLGDLLLSCITKAVLTRWQNCSAVDNLMCSLCSSRVFTACNVTFKDARCVLHNSCVIGQHSSHTLAVAPASLRFA